MINLLDDHGQPLNRLYNRKRLNDRAIDELIGMGRGIVADGMVNEKEGRFLKSWMEANVSFCEDPLVNQLYRRIQEMLIDGILDEHERLELLGILKQFSGETTVDHPQSLSSTLPICYPLPPIEFPRNVFCLTGTFAYGPRRICEAVIIERGGETAKTVTKGIDYLVIGTLSSPDWIHTSYGRKIEKAIEYRSRYNRMSIISEDHWAEAAFQ